MKLPLFDFIDQTLLKNINSTILSIPGLGISYDLSAYAHQKKINYIDDLGQPISSYNILDLNANQRPDFITQVDKYFRQKYQATNLQTFFCVIINSPKLISSPEYQNSYFSSHLYQTFINPPFTLDQTTEFFNRNQFETQHLNDIHSLGNGLPKLMKFLYFNPQYLTSYQNLSNNRDLQQIILPTIKELANSPPEITNLFPSPLIHLLLDQYSQSHPSTYQVTITLDSSHLSLRESTDSPPVNLTITEYKLLKLILANNLTITRDQIAEIKWKKDSFTKYSDQAINTTITRLNQKINRYQLKPISGLGYRLVSSTRP